MVHLTMSPSTLVCHDSQAHNGGNKGLLPLPVASTIPFQISLQIPSTFAALALGHCSICEFVYFGKGKKLQSTKQQR